VKWRVAGSKGWLSIQGLQPHGGGKHRPRFARDHAASCCEHGDVHARGSSGRSSGGRWADAPGHPSHPHLAHRGACVAGMRGRRQRVGSFRLSAGAAMPVCCLASSGSSGVGLFVSRVSRCGRSGRAASLWLCAVQQDSLSPTIRPARPCAHRLVGMSSNNCCIDTPPARRTAIVYIRISLIPLGDSGLRELKLDI